MIVEFKREGDLTMESTTLFKKNYHIDLRDVDLNKSLKLSSLFSFFQDIASLAAENLGYGINELGEKFGVAWILMRLRVDILRHPRLDEEITIETWPQVPKKLEFERDYIVRDRNGNIIIRAVSAWVIMDIHERKLKRTDVINIQYPSIMEERAIECKLGKIKDFGYLQNAYKKVIGYSDIDFNGHLNNSKYVDYIMDCFTVEEHQKYHVTSIEVNFKNEALPGDIIHLFKDTSNIQSNQIYIEGKKEETEKLVFKAQVTIKKI